MEKKIPVLNFLLIFIAAILIIMIIRIWADPMDASKIDGSLASGSPKSLQKISTQRKTYPAAIVSQITRKNLFRKERVEFKVQAPVVAAPALAVLIPPPRITVNGILLLQGTRIAVIEGHYSVMIDGAKTESKKIKKKGYRVGDYIGNYQIIEISRALVTLKNKTGDVLTAKLKQRASATPIKWDGNNLVYKPKKPGDEPMPIPAATPKPPPVQAKPVAAQLNPAPEAPKPTVPHISGRPQSTRRRPAFISGARTAPQRARQHISGR